MPHFTLSHTHTHTHAHAGNMILGVMHGAVQGQKAAQYVAAARNLSKGCWEMYNTSPLKLAPESMLLHNASQRFLPVTPYNMLRPEAIESWFYLWRYTGDVRYRAQGWAVFQAFERHSRMENGAFR